MARRPLTMANVKPIRIAGGKSGRMGAYASGGVIQLQLDQKAVGRALARLENFRDEPLHIRMDKATKAAGALLVAPMQAAAPRKTGRLRKSIASRTVRNRDKAVFAKGTTMALGADRVALVGPRASPWAPHRHLVIQGHRIVTRGGRDTGRRTAPNPFVYATAHRHYARAIALMRDHIVKAGLNQGVGTAILYGRATRRKR